MAVGLSASLLLLRPKQRGFLAQLVRCKVLLLLLRAQDSLLLNLALLLLACLCPPPLLLRLHCIPNPLSLSERLVMPTEHDFI